MKIIKKLITIILALTTLIFTLSINGFATEAEEIKDCETAANNSEFIKVFDGYISFYYSDQDFMYYDYCYELKPAASDEEPIALYVNNQGFSDTYQSLVFEFDNSFLDEETVYLFSASSEEEGTVIEKTFTLSESRATTPEFIFSYYSFEEYDVIDMSEELLMPIDFNKDVILCSNNVYSAETGGSSYRVISIDGLTVTANECGNGYLKLIDEEENTLCQTQFRIKEKQAYSFSDALALSSRKFFESSAESAENFLWFGSSILEALLVPFLLLGVIIEIPFSM